jgi:uncharacterized delta-60 repeat protein
MTIQLFVLSLSLLLAAAPAAADCPSDLDQFGSNGRSERPEGLRGAGHDVVVTAGGAILVAGSVDGEPAVLRYTNGGSFDGTFGAEGVASIDADGYFDRLAVLGDGSILVSGVVHVPPGSGEGEPTPATVLAKFTSTGEIVESFGSNDGFTLVRFGDGSTPHDMLVRGDGNIVVVGQSRQNDVWRATVFFFGPNGSLSAQLGSARALPGLPSAVATAVTLLENNAILIVGYDTSGDGGRVFLARMTGLGALDTNYGKGGIRILASPKVIDEAWGVERDADGRVYVSGTATSINRPRRTRLVVRRFLANGTRDTSYGRRGKAVAVPGGKWSTRDFDVSDDGVVTTTSFRSQIGTNIARFTEDGVLDRAFGHLGIENILDVRLAGMDIPDSGKIVAAGADDLERPLVMRFEGGEWDGEAPCVADCGDGEIGPGEECDDSNTDNGDGCSVACLNE